MWNSYIFLLFRSTCNSLNLDKPVYSVFSSDYVYFPVFAEVIPIYYLVAAFREKRTCDSFAKITDLPFLSSIVSFSPGRGFVRLSGNFVFVSHETDMLCE